ncbi:hypothetical protein MUP65_00750, partial [Patescibacteria group bacterium]|nr:hypothetical protein [Patescibacteria group bacterium]
MVISERPVYALDGLSEGHFFYTPNQERASQLSTDLIGPTEFLEQLHLGTATKGSGEKLLFGGEKHALHYIGRNFELFVAHGSLDPEAVKLIQMANYSQFSPKVRADYQKILYPTYQKLFTLPSYPETGLHLIGN